MAKCEDFPCCGHTQLDPCEPQEYDRPGYYDTTIRGNEHNLCNHEEGECNVEDYDEDDDEDFIYSVDDPGYFSRGAASL